MDAGVILRVPRFLIDMSSRFAVDDVGLHCSDWVRFNADVNIDVDLDLGMSIVPSCAELRSCQSGFDSIDTINLADIDCDDGIGPGGAMQSSCCDDARPMSLAASDVGRRSSSASDVDADSTHEWFTMPILDNSIVLPFDELSFASSCQYDGPITSSHLSVAVAPSPIGLSVGDARSALSCSVGSRCSQFDSREWADPAPDDDMGSLVAFPGAAYHCCPVVPSRSISLGERRYGEVNISDNEEGDAYQN